MIPRNLVPDHLYNSVFIAGGFAACPALASDIDVWVPYIGGEDLLLMRRQLLSHLHAEGFVATEEEGGTVHDYNGVAINILKVAVIDGGTPIHLMVCNAPVDIVLQNFDISTHQIALTANGVVKGAGWTSTMVPPVVFEDKENEHTPERLKKIAERYGF